MEYRHRVPTLEELRQNRLVLEQKNKHKESWMKRAFGSKNDKNLKTIEELKEGLEIENDIIIAHLENQNELLLELVKKIDRK